jgi:PKD domain
MRILVYFMTILFSSSLFFGLTSITSNSAALGKVLASDDTMIMGQTAAQEEVEQVITQQKEQLPLADTSTTPISDNVTSTIPPTALAGADQVVKEGDKVTLDGTGSFDPDGTIVSYKWMLEEWDDEDPPATLSGANTTIATFTAPVLNSTSGAYGLDLTVTDNDGLTHTDSKVVTVKKAASEESNIQ